jgi:hypothetical protein
MCTKAQTPLVRFVVQQAVRLVVKLWISMDLLYSFSTSCGQVESHTPLFRFAVNLFSSPRQIHNILTCIDVVDLSKSREVVDLLWSCCGFVVDLLYNLLYTTNPQQIEQVEFELEAPWGTAYRRMTTND